MRNETQYKAKFELNGFIIEVTATYWGGSYGSYFEPEEFTPTKILIDGENYTNQDDEIIAALVGVEDYWDFWAEATEVLYSANEHKIYPHNSSEK